MDGERTRRIEVGTLLVEYCWSGELGALGDRSVALVWFAAFAIASTSCRVISPCTSSNRFLPISANIAAPSAVRSLGKLTPNRYITHSPLNIQRFTFSCGR